MAGYQYRGSPHILGIHKELFEKRETRESGQRPDGESEAAESETEVRIRQGPLSIAEIFGLKPS